METTCLMTLSVATFALWMALERLDLLSFDTLTYKVS